MRKTIFSYLFLLLSLSVLGQDKYNYRYWFDVNDRKCVLGTSQSNVWNIDVDVSELDDALHSFNIQVQDSVGMWSSPISKYFYKKYTSDYIVKYWFDGDFTTAKDINEIGTTSIDVSHLKDGFHTIQSVVKSKGALSNVETRYFIKIPQTVGVDYMTCFCYIDDKAYKQERVSSSGGILNWTFDVESLSQGLHRVQIFLVTPSGAMSSTANGFFLRVPTQNELTTLKCYYTIDGADNDGAENKYIQAGTYSNGLYHFDLDVANISDGLHRLTYMLIGEDGMITSSKSSFFYKTPLGGNGISRWEYWVNGNYSIKHINTLDVPKTPLQIISLLPVESYPIRSSCFDIRVEDEKPVLYAKNDINFRFYDKAGRITDVSKQYVDESVRQELNQDEMPVLQLGVATRINRPADNEIKWYKFEAEEGDSLVLYTDRTCTFDVFSPTGKPVYSASGAEAVKASGTHLYETGTFYVAIHDMTAKYGNDINLNFQLIDKYAVLEYSPNKSANIGLVDLWFKGNGFDYLKSVRLENEEVSINADSLVYCNNVIAKAHFDFYKNEAKLGDYNIILDFYDNAKDSVIVIPNGFKIEEAIKGDIEVTVETERILADPYPITVKLKNTGNVGYWGIPLNIAYDNVDAFDGVDFIDFSLAFPNDTINPLAPPYVIVDNLVGLGLKGLFMPLVIPYIGPNEEYILTLGARAKGHTRFNLYAWAGTPWSEEQQEQLYSIKTIAPKEYSDALKVQSNLTTARQMGGLGVSNVRVAVGIGAALGGIVITGTHARENMYQSMGAGVMGDNFEDYRMQYRGTPVSPSSIAENCLPNNHHLNDYAGLLFQMAENATPRPCPNPIETLAPGDPNEMYGYKSESGSHYINNDVSNVYYDIEFENDPEIATASAHTIIVTDTIDSRYHNLSSFAATKVIIGDAVLNLNGEKEFVKTLDLRPRIDVIAQVELKYNESTGVAQWIISSLDPMTMEPTIDAMQGVLPVNSNGDGVGRVSYDITLKNGLSDGTDIKSRAGIVFDSEAKIMTPYWINTTDYVNPVSRIDTIECVNDSVVTLRFSGEDNRSGVWKYSLYVQPGDDSAWSLAKENIEVDSCEYKVYNGINYGFCVVATDSAGNVEQKELIREFNYIGFTIGDANSDGIIDAVDVVLAISKYLGEEPKINFSATDVVKDGVIDSQDVVGIQNLFLNSNLNLYSVKRQRKLILIE